MKYLSVGWFVVGIGEAFEHLIDTAWSNTG